MWVLCLFIFGYLMWVGRTTILTVTMTVFSTLMTTLTQKQIGRLTTIIWFEKVNFGASLARVIIGNTESRTSTNFRSSIQSDDHGRPQTFFQGRAKFSRGGGAKTYYLPKKHLKTYYFPLKKSKNILFSRVKGPLLPSPADAHVKGSIKQFF